MQPAGLAYFTKPNYLVEPGHDCEGVHALLVNWHYACVHA